MFFGSGRTASIGMWIFYHVLGKQQIGHASFSEICKENQNGQSVFVALSVYIIIHNKWCFQMLRFTRLVIKPVSGKENQDEAQRSGFGLERSRSRMRERRHENVAASDMTLAATWCG